VLGPQGSSFLVRALGYGETMGLARRAVMTLIDVSRLRDVKRLQAVIDSMAAHIAVLDKQGSIRRVNTAWTRFALANSAPPGAEVLPRMTSVEVGANYLGALAHATSPDALEVLRGLQQVLSGQRERYQTTYPCHSPTEQRWFAMQATRLQGDEPGAVVCHFDITPWREVLQRTEVIDG
jgi:two-component system CheB/CheR fusion protein